MNAILKTREKEKEPIHMLDTAVDREPLLCINESRWAYGAKIGFLKLEGKGEKVTKRVSSGRSEKIRTGVFAY